MSCLGILALALVVCPGCATKTYVQEQIAPTQEQVDQVEKATQENKAGIEKNADDIQKLADSTMSGMKELEDKMMGMKSELGEVRELAEGKLVYATVLSDESIKFDFNSWELSEEAMAKLDQLADKLTAANKNQYIEIIGHTDWIDSEKVNEKVGKYRAYSVAKYLYGKGIPLHRISMCTMGEASPIADNESKEGRAENRRVTVKILE
jgi:outer membrane protein OmpA-like peptidoglycan-associated protein